MNAPPVLSVMRNGTCGTLSSRKTTESSGPNDAHCPLPDTPEFVKTSSPANARSQPFDVLGSPEIVTTCGGAPSFTYARPESGTFTSSSAPIVNGSASGPASAPGLVCDGLLAESLHPQARARIAPAAARHISCF